MTTTHQLEIQNRKGKLILNDVVHKDSADKLIEELGKLYGPSAVAAKMIIGEAMCKADDALESVEVEINSPGGSVMEGQRIYSALREMSARGVAVSTTVNGLAASMGSVILMAGDERRMTKGSRVMIHEASTIAWGDARTLRKNADLLEGISAEIAEIYADRTGGDQDAIRNLMLAETWMTAEQAKENGFIHAIIRDGKAEKFDTEPKDMSIFARLFPNNEEAVAKLDAMLEDNETLRTDLEAAQAKIGDLTAAAEELLLSKTELAEAKAQIAASEKLAAENAQVIADLTAAAEVTEEKIAAKASELLAATGHPAPVALVGDGGNAKSILVQFNELKGSDATRFYTQHRDAILAEQSKFQS